MFTILNGQEQTSRYSVFADTPSKVPKNLLDSLKNESNEAIRFRLIDSIARIHLKFGDTDSIISYGEMMEKEAEFSKNELVSKTYWLAKSYYIQGEGKRLNGLFDPALGFHIKALKLDIDDESIFHENQLGLAKAYFFKNEYDKALPLLLDTYENAEDLSVSANAALYLGLLYKTKDESVTTDQFLAQALDRATRARNDKLRLAVELY